jgi:glutathione S-transferase
MQLYLLQGCPFGHRASMSLQEKRLPFEPIFFQQGKRPPALEAIGPYAKSPTLIDGDNKVWEAQIVLEYLEDRYPERPLLPADPAQRAAIRMLAARVASELGSKLGTVAIETLYKPQKDEAMVATAVREFSAALADWDRYLDGRSFLVGDALSLADITLFTVFPAMRKLAGVEIPAELSHLSAWFARMTKRPTAALLEPARV